LHKPANDKDNSSLSEDKKKRCLLRRRSINCKRQPQKSLNKKKYEVLTLNEKRSLLAMLQRKSKGKVQRKEFETWINDTRFSEY
jgi:Leu/Phe-tRNA-protein transferase